MNVLEGAIEDAQFRHAAGSIPLRSRNGPGAVKLGFRPEDAELVDPGAEGALAGEIYVVEPLGNEVLVAVKVADELLNVRMPAGFDRPVGDRCAVRPVPDRSHLFDVQTGESLARPPGSSGATVPGADPEAAASLGKEREQHG